MPRTLKRRADAISRDKPVQSPAPESEEEEEEEEQEERRRLPPSTRRRRSSSVSSAISSTPSLTSQAPTSHAAGGVESNERNNNSENNTTTSTLIKKLVRLALSTEYSRLPLRRNDISTKILKDNNASHRLFKPVFNGAQKILRTTFGMELVELPSREKTTLKERRRGAGTQQQQSNTTKSKSQTQDGGGGGGAGGSAAAANKSWILTSILPPAYKQNPLIVRPTKARGPDTEATYTSLYTFILALIYLQPSHTLPEPKLERYLKRVNLDTFTPLGALEKVLTRMVREGYVDRRRDTSSGEEVVEFVAGPRGRIEVGVKGVAGLVRAVNGFGAGSEEGEEGGDGNGNDNDNADGEGREGEDQTATDRSAGGGTGSSTTRPKIERDELERKLARSLGFAERDTGGRDGGVGGG